MNRKKLLKLQRELDGMRRRTIKASDAQALATKLGRRQSDRGKEPMWKNTHFPQLFVLAIPDHGGRDLSPGVKCKILNLLENEDIAAWEERLGSNGHDERHTEDDDDAD